MSDLISIREAAHRLGVSADTLRQWERDKRLTAERTEGGHRRFRVEDIERFLARRSKTGSTSSSAPGTRPQPVPKATAPGGGRFQAGMHVEPFWEGQLQSARARVEIKRLRREAMEQQAQIDRGRALAELEAEALKRRELHHQRLQDLKAFGRALMPGAAGAEVRAEITRELEEYVAVERFPLELPLADAKIVVRARVDSLLPRLEQQRAEATAKAERESQRASERQQLEWLITSGLLVARRETCSWETIDQARALRDVEEQLREEVRANWSYSQVAALVTELLSEFEECDSDDEDADPEEDEEGGDDDEG